MAASPGSENGDIGFQIAPMVDVVFVLMLFFMANAAMQVQEKELTIDLPSRPKPVGQITLPVATLVIDIREDGAVLGNEQLFGNPGDSRLESLREWLKTTLAQFGPDSPVVIRPHPDTQHDRVMDVLNAVNGTKIKEGAREMGFKLTTFS